MLMRFTDIHLFIFYTYATINTVIDTKIPLDVG